MTPGRRPSGLLLDMDGTLIDTEPVWFAAERAAVRRFGGHLPAHAFEELLGKDADGVVRTLIHTFGARTDATRLRDAIVEELGSQLERAQPMPGAAELVGAALQAGVACAVVSNSPALVVEATLAAHDWARELRIRVSADDAQRPKPAPDLYLLALRRIGVPEVEAVAVEDSPTGAAAAVAAGVRCIAVCGPHAPTAALTAHTPHLAADLHEVAAMLDLTAPRTQPHHPPSTGAER